MSLASPATIPSLAPGASSTVTVELSPPSNLPLEEYTGTIAISGAQTGISVPVHLHRHHHRHRQRSGAGGRRLHVRRSRFAARAGRHGEPPEPVRQHRDRRDRRDRRHRRRHVHQRPRRAVRLAGAGQRPLELRELVHRRSGHHEQRRGLHRRASSSPIPGTWCRRRSRTPTRSSSRQPSRRTCRRPWSPSPRRPPSPRSQPGQSGTFNVTITNHGLIAAQGVTLNLPTDPEYTFTALSTDIGVVPAESSVVVPITVTRAAPQSLSISDDGTTLTTKVVVPNPIGLTPPRRSMWIIPIRAPWPYRRRSWC